MSSKTNRGFTLTEILLVLGIVGFLSIGVLGFFLQSLRSGNASEQQIALLTSMRSFTNEMVFVGSRSQEMILYNSAEAADRTYDGRKEVANDDTDTYADDICPTGDFVVFVYYELPKPASQAHYRIRKLVGYYLDGSDTSSGPLMRLTIDLSASPSSDSVEEILSDHWSSADRRTVAHLVAPLALSDGYNDDTTPQLFYKRANQNLAVCGQLIESASHKNTEDLRTYTRTFYFTVTVRS